jgi:DNA polymerase II large subunit
LGRKICLEKRKTVDCITLSGRVYFDLFSKILNLRENAKNKRVSPQLINSNEAFIKGLIGGYIVGDGHIDKNSIKISSVNKELINGFSLLLTQCGALPHFTEENRAIKTGLVADFYLKKGKQIRIHSYNLRLYSTDLIKVGKSLFGQKKGKYDAIIKLNNFRHKRETRFGDFAIDELKEAVPLSSATKYVYDLIVEGEKNFIAGFGQLGVYDCDGDQDALMLLMDSLLNFSNKYLSMKSGGRMDAPLVFTIIINPSEVDDEVHKMETCWDFPLDLYEKSANVCEPSIDIESVKERLEKPAQYSGIGFTHDTEIFDEGPKTSRYIQLKTMDEKIQRQNALQKKILAVNAKDALEKVMGSHFLPDIIGNARAFSRQTFRCTSCNEKYRRIPLSGKCYKCGKPTLILTIHEGSVRKYLKIAQTMAVQENLSPYLLQRLNMIEKEINSVFKSDTVKQKSLFEFA